MLSCSSFGLHLEADFALNSGAFLSSQPLCHAANHCPCTGGRDSEPLTYLTTDSHFLCLSAQAGLPMSMLALLLGCSNLHEGAVRHPHSTALACCIPVLRCMVNEVPVAARPTAGWDDRSLCWQQKPRIRIPKRLNHDQADTLHLEQSVKHFKQNRKPQTVVGRSVIYTAQKLQRLP